ncbi:MAG: glycerate kinase [Candidatus Thiodiazotropha sp.]|nr:glycerate kinase [Candidatus Thiodiazotropha sp. (ex Lucina pensylvanica)]MBT3061862.1 glycerate kinase [Candidatus Thiodiazotropha sp. (ex Lucina pensylvanica)]PUB72887.1 MAG: glycerate kinase [gamma proteobacterium symbiont of Ctena orbiculata]PUB76158.1 MAG: glycerate kinase [gamma proteobacterium symbiont of Ctena orbiculata]
MDSQRDILLDLFRASVDAALPASCLPQHLPEPPKGRTLVVGAGKAAASMAKAVEEHWDGPLSGLVITRYDHGVPLERIELVEAAHPVPDEAGRQAARRILEMALALGPDDMMLCLISGGGSALLALPADGVTLEDKQRINKSLLRSGATISEMNCVRKHLSAIKGGRLAAAASPAQVVTLLISDVPGDDPSVIASGPTVADPTTFADALAILRKYGIEEPKAVVQHLEEAGEETPKPGDERLERAETVMLATAQDALEAAAAKAQSLGYKPLILGNSIEGESRDVASVHAGIALQIATHGQPAEAPCVLLSGGETTVTVKGSGRGGRDAEFLLALAVALDSHPRIHAIACDTDGIDGTEDNAGALLDPESLGRAEQLGLKAVDMLNDNNGYHFFARLDDLVITGPTRTNVNDFRAILIDE